MKRCNNSNCWAVAEDMANSTRARGPVPGRAPRQTSWGGGLMAVVIQPSRRRRIYPPGMLLLCCPFSWLFLPGKVLLIAWPYYSVPAITRNRGCELGSLSCSEELAAQGKPSPCSPFTAQRHRVPAQGPNPVWWGSATCWAQACADQLHAHLQVSWAISSS